MQKQKLHYALCANLKDSITHRVYKLQFIGLTRMNINEILLSGKTFLSKIN